MPLEVTPTSQEGGRLIVAMHILPLLREEEDREACFKPGPQVHLSSDNPNIAGQNHPTALLPELP